jgi:hypothetical protein
MSTFFDDLLESVRQMDEILRRARRPSREFHIVALQGQAKENRDHSNVFVEEQQIHPSPKVSPPIRSA